MMDLIFSLGRSEIICANSVNFAIGSSRVWSLTTKLVIFCLSDYFLFSFFRFYLGQYCVERSKKEPPPINRCITHLLPEANLAHFLKRIYIISFPRRLSARIGQAPCCILLSKTPALSALACSARRTYKASFLIYQSLIAAVRAS